MNDQHLDDLTLSLYFDGEVEDAAEARALGEHVAACSVCRRRLQALAQVHEQIAAPVDRPERDASASVQRALWEAPLPPARPSSLRWLAPAAVVVAVVGVFAGLLQLAGSGSSSKSASSGATVTTQSHQRAYGGVSGTTSAAAAPVTTATASGGVTTTASGGATTTAASGATTTAAASGGAGASGPPTVPAQLPLASLGSVTSPAALRSALNPSGRATPYPVAARLKCWSQAVAAASGGAGRAALQATLTYEGQAAQAFAFSRPGGDLIVVLAAAGCHTLASVVA